MAALAAELRKDLERAVAEARRLAEAAARASLERLGVASEQAPAGLSDEDRKLRVQLRARVKAETTAHVVEAIAYVAWHRMLFARFLAENGLLRHPDGAAVSLADVRELAAEEGERDPWVLAARYAAAMLPGIFGTGDPVERVALAPEDRLRLEQVLERLPPVVFTADDSLGWVYQFWQSERKKQVNDSGAKIGAAELPAVTQLFTEDYMVRFLLENSLGAWWAGRHPQSPLLRKWEYLRFRDDGTPAAGTFEGWPERAAEVTVMDPCCGSGHFLVAAAGMLRDMRIEEEGLSPARAAAAVIADNLHGLELDPRCLQLAAFNLALDAWKAGGHQELPVPDLACSGIAIKGQRSEWHRLAGGDRNMRDALDRLYDLFQDAPELGSLIDPRSAAGDGVWRVDVDDLLARLDRALDREAATDPAAAVFGDAAKGTAKAARLLAGRYWLVATNPPFLRLGGSGGQLEAYARRAHPHAYRDISTSFLERLPELAEPLGGVATVTPSTWFFLRSYQRFRERLLNQRSLQFVAELGEGAFSGITGGVVRVCLVALSPSGPVATTSFAYIDASAGPDEQQKSAVLRHDSPDRVSQPGQLRNPQARITFEAPSEHLPLGEFMDSLHGLGTFDAPRYSYRFWELSSFGRGWVMQQTTPTGKALVDGLHGALRWEDGAGALAASMLARAERGYSSGKWRAGSSAWGKRGVAVWTMGRMSVNRYLGTAFDENVTVLLPHDPSNLPAIAAFAEDPAFEREVRKLDSKLHVTPHTYRAVPFDLEHWTRVAREKYPDGLPEPHSDDPTQWLFKGNVAGSEAPLQVAVARLLGYRWPDQGPDELDELADADGLVPLTPVAGERSADDRLRELLARAYGDAWTPALLERLLADAGSPGATLEAWLRDDFFAQHAKLFHNRPFVWHVWDGRKDGFGVLCHYHRLDRARLEKLTYTLLGDWVERQRAARNEPGAEPRLVAALGLQDRLKLIIEGEAPHDVYVRWKPLGGQAIGWEPDLDDGVRLNIRPFVTAGVLRARVSVKWDKDRGRDPDGSERVNDRHPTLAERRAARAVARG